MLHSSNLTKVGVSPEQQATRYDLHNCPWIALNRVDHCALKVLNCELNNKTDFWGDSESQFRSR